MAGTGRYPNNIKKETIYVANAAEYMQRLYQGAK